MRRTILKFAAILLIAVIVAEQFPTRRGDPQWQNWRTGDVIALNGVSFRSRIVRLLQGYSSDFSHVGIVVLHNNVPYIVHADPAEGRVVEQRWDLVCSPSEASGGALFRLKPINDSIARNASVTAEYWAKIKVPFDEQFDLSSRDKLYCTELVWRAYQSAGVDLCPDLQTRNHHLLPADLLGSQHLRLVFRF